jgi:uncharacterized protein YciI
MPFAIITTFTPGTDARRAAVRDAHVEYLKARSELLLAAGVLLETTSSPRGSLILVDTEDRAQAQALADGDPFQLAGLLSEVSVLPWRKAFFDRTYLA